MHRPTGASRARQTASSCSQRLASKVYQMAARTAVEAPRHLAAGVSRTLPRRLLFFPIPTLSTIEITDIAVNPITGRDAVDIVINARIRRAIAFVGVDREVISDFLIIAVLPTHFYRTRKRSINVQEIEIFKDHIASQDRRGLAEREQGCACFP